MLYLIFRVVSCEASGFMLCRSLDFGPGGGKGGISLKIIVMRGRGGGDVTEAGRLI